MKMKSLFASFLLIAAVVCLLPGTRTMAAPAEIKHRLLVVDESRGQLHYVNQNDPSKDWTLKLPERYRDIQLLDGGKILMSTMSGYQEFDMKTRKSLKEVKNPLFEGSAAVRRLRDGGTVIGCNQKNMLVFYEMNKRDEVVTSATFPTLNTLRLFRFSPRGTLLFGANGDQVVEADLKGRILRSIKLEGSRHIYQVNEKPNGNLLAASGYGGEVVEMDPKGTVVKRVGGKPFPQGIVYNFFAGMQVLKNGNIVVCNWTGHGAEDSKLAPQLIEFSPDGKIVWKWHDPKRSGTAHGIIVLDDPGVVWQK